MPDFVEEIICHFSPWDSGRLSDDIMAEAGDGLAAVINEEDRAS
jgi:hypothetical protein